ncbi:MAG: hypothetical protein ABJC39_03565 [Chloroflexota bacterium]
MSRSTRRRTPMAIAAVLWLVTGCAAGAPAGSPAGSSTGATVTVPATAEAPSSHATTTDSPAASGSYDPSQPPAASLAVEGGDPVVGQLGTFTWGDGGSDSPWLPGSPIEAASGERLAVGIGGGVSVASWSARRVAAGIADGTGAVGLGSGAAPAAFEAPPAGTWWVAVTLDFADNLGSATYYWAVTVR